MCGEIENNVISQKIFAYLHLSRRFPSDARAVRQSSIAWMRNYFFLFKERPRLRTDQGEERERERETRCA